MREMRDSGVPWIGEIPMSWMTGRMKNILSSLKSGGTPASDNPLYYSDNGTPWVAIGDMKHGGMISRAQKCLTNEGLLAKSLVVFPKGTLLYSIYASVGKVSVLQIPAAINQAILALVLNNRAEQRYAKYLLMAMEDYVLSLANGNTQFNLNASIVSNLPIVIPTLQEQDKVAVFLDAKCMEIDSVLEKTRASIEEYKKLKQSVITEAVTKGIRGNRQMTVSGVEWIGEMPMEWRVCKMKHVISVLAGYAFSSDSFSNQGTRLLRGINVTPQGLRWEETVYWNDPIDSSIEPYQLRSGDLVLGLDRPWIKEGTRVAFVNETDLPCLLLQRVCRIRPRRTSEIRFVYWVIASSIFEEALTMDTTGISIPHISTGQLDSFLFALPPLSEQQEIAAYLDEKCAAIDSLIASKEALITELDAYKKSLTYEYVTGKKVIPTL